MMKRWMLVAAWLACNLLTTGCSTLADARAAKGTGVAREYAVPEERVWRALPEALKELELPLVGENRQEGYALAQRGITWASYGEHVAIFIQSIKEATQTRVEVVSKKAMATNLFAPDWGVKVLDALDRKLKTASKVERAPLAGAPD